VYGSPELSMMNTHAEWNDRKTQDPSLFGGFLSQGSSDKMVCSEGVLWTVLLSRAHGQDDDVVFGEVLLRFNPAHLVEKKPGHISLRNLSN